MEISQQDFINGVGLADGDVRLVVDEFGGKEQKTYYRQELIRNITPDAMRDRFTFEERVAIKSSADVRVQTFYDDLSMRKRLVNIDSERFALAMQLLLSEKLIALGREVDLLRDGSPDEQS